MKIYDLFENRQVKEVVICFGRFNPPTKGHITNIVTAYEYALEHNYDFYLILSKTNDDKNPIEYEQKYKLIKKMLPDDLKILFNKKTRTLSDIINFVTASGYRKLHLAVGDDRVTDMSNALKKLDGLLWEIVNTGKRTKGLSGSYARKYAKKNNFDDFVKLYDDPKIAKEVFDILVKYYKENNKKTLAEMLNINKKEEI